VLSLILPAAGSSASAQISPGPLARPHQALEGTRNCLACHGTRKDAMDAACLGCHKEIAFLRTERRGLHGRPAQQKCASCHPDHAGVEFNLTAWNADSVSRFDHRRAGWTLEGQHRDTRCQECHATSLQTGRAAQLAPTGATRPQWTGLETTCASCHEDVHQESVGSTCAECHTAEGWAPATRFNHAETQYPLTGRHERVPCQQCHAARQGSPEPGGSLLNPVFQPIASGQCSSCHRDTHGGRLGSACSDCHVTSGFADRKAGGFNHSRTRYALDGKHAQVPCDACHGPVSRRINPAFGTCADCHADRHRGTATIAGTVLDCATCHDTRGFGTVTLDVARHAATRYPLEGRHTAVACASCHLPQPDGALLKPAFAGCVSCHADGHGDQLATVTGEATCERCHAVSGWDQSRYPAADHATTGLALEGRHAAVACTACHAATWENRSRTTGDTGALGPAKVRFTLGGVACANCHADPHRTDTTTARLPECSSCHTATSFRPATVTAATHAEVGYPLLGAHRAVPCVTCHTTLAGRTATGPALAGQPAPPPLDLRIPDQQCASCHESPHGDQFAARDATGCAACHSEEAFRPADRFDHQRDAAFSLDGAHATVPCDRCHATSQLPGGGSRVQYRLSTFTCEACHAKRPA